MNQILRAETRVIDRPNSVRANDVFRPYKKEKPQAVRETDVKEDKVLAQLEEALVKFISQWKLVTAFHWVACEVHCEEALALIRDIKYTAKDVEKFTVSLQEFIDLRGFDFKVGLFLSVLVNNCDDDLYLLQLKHLDVKIQDIGFRNNKDIVIDGNVGANLGLEMSSGKLLLNGSSGNCLGWRMSGGTIEIKGDVGLDTGVYMVNGDIYLNGRYGKISDHIIGGRIFHKGKQIFPIGESE